MKNKDMESRITRSFTRIRLEGEARQDILLELQQEALKECWQRHTKELAKLPYKQLFEDEGKKTNRPCNKPSNFADRVNNLDE
jgi:hypothetical protein